MKMNKVGLKMCKKNKAHIFFIVFFIILVVGCRPPTAQGGKKSDYRSGTDGLIINFLSDAPPNKIFADAPYNDIEIPISIEIKNTGAYPTPEDEGAWEENGNAIFISGFDKNIIKGWKLGDEDLSEYPSVNLNDKVDVLRGKSMNNPEGSYELFHFIGLVDMSRVNVERYNPNFLVTACYEYRTKASPIVCIDPMSFTTTKEKKICNIHDVSLKNQGAPIAVTKIEENALSNSIQFKIHFKNVGKGDVIAIDNLLKCSSSGEEKLKRGDMDFVKIVDVKVGEESIKEDCGQLLSVADKGDYARLINNEGFIVCNLKDYKKDIEYAYTKNLYIELAYGYRNVISKEVEIVKVPEP